MTKSFHDSMASKRVSPPKISPGCLVKGIMIGFALFLVSLVVVSFGLYAFAKSFIRGEKFRQMVAEQTAEPLMAETQIDSLSWKGTEAYANKFTAQGYQDSGFQKLEISGLRALIVLNMDNFFNKRVWEVDGITVSQFDLHLNKEGRLAGTYKDAHPDGPVTEPSKRSGPDFGDLLPKETLIRPIKISNANIYYTDKQQVAEATGIRTELEMPEQKGGLTRVKAYGGNIVLRSLDPKAAEKGLKFPKLEIDELDLRWKEKDFFISKARAFSEDGAEINLDGDVEMSAGKMLVRANVSGLKAVDMVPPDWSKRVKGTIAVDTTLSGDPNKSDQILQKGKLTITDGVLEAFPVLDTIATYLNAQQFRRIALSKATADFTRVGTQTTVQNILLQSDGLARLEGNLEITGDKLAGRAEFRHRARHHEVDTRGGAKGLPGGTGWPSLDGSECRRHGSETGERSHGPHAGRGYRGGHGNRERPGQAEGTGDGAGHRVSEGFLQPG